MSKAETPDRAFAPVYVPTKINNWTTDGRFEPPVLVLLGAVTGWLTFAIFGSLYISAIFVSLVCVIAGHAMRLTAQEALTKRLAEPVQHRIGVTVLGKRKLGELARELGHEKSGEFTCRCVDRGGRLGLLTISMANDRTYKIVASHFFAQVKQAKR